MALAEAAMISSTILLLLVFYFYVAYRISKNRPVPPIEWPIIRMLPSVVANLSKMHDYAAALLLSELGNTLTARGPASSGMRLVITCDPANVRHILASSSHGNYPKGPEFAEIFDVFGGGFFTVDGERWRRERAKIDGFIREPRLVASMASSCRDKVRDCLLPLLASAAGAGRPVEMRDVASRLMFDVTAMGVFGVDPGYLPVSGGPPEMPPAHAAAAIDTVMEVAVFRHVVPASWWKAMRRLNVGPERRLAAAHAVLLGFASEMMETRKKKATTTTTHSDAMDITSYYLSDPDHYNADQNLLRAMLVNFMIAGRDTIGTVLPWFFYSLATNQHVVAGIRQELAPIAAAAAAASRSRGNDAGAAVMFEPDDTKPLVYLQAALLEALRLYPPVAMERKTVAAADVLPSGHRVWAGDAILVHLYSMGRMESVWGEDCREYRPDRWLTGDGGQQKLRHVPSHNFPAFNAGPRMCPGKSIAMTEMKTVAAAVVWNFDVEVAVEGQAVEPTMSATLRMKNGLMLKVKKRTYVDAPV
ncbi:alkane hydroxylase MAH1-like [Oryza brachyantha]|uniref:alkane hydroxylase MAH1-like n=1 Tax=Oryza brachyantha TaxID=4533 RepID=UPI001ADC3281|nr:alkane hydroxylase MAH1-like [Oryza brachyantha]